MMQTQRDKYLVMLIITDGEIHDMQQSIQQIVNASRLPLSILIVGVGNDDFHNMEVWMEGGCEIDAGWRREAAQL